MTGTGAALVLGRALHAPWNEGTRVINRNFARVAESQRQVRVVSMTDRRFRLPTGAAPRDGELSIEHVYTYAGYGLAGLYAAVPSVVRRLAADLAAHPVRAAHLFGVPLSLAPWLRRRRVRVIVHVMGRSIRPQDRALVWASMRLLDHWVDAYAVSSETLVPTLLGYGIRRSKLMVLPPAVDTALFQPGDRLAARRRLAIDPSEALVIYLGRPSPRRFPAGAVGAAVAAAAARTARRVRFIALTPGSTFDGSENSAARLLAYRRAATRQLRAVPGLVAEVRQTDLTDADKVAWLRAADAVLLPFSAPEAVEPPLSLLEAMACGALPVVTPAANRSGLIRSGDNGLVYEAPAQLAAVLSDLLERGDGAVLGERARHAVLERHSPAAVAAAANALWARVEHTPGRSTDGPW